MKSYRMSLAYGLTSNKDQALMNKSCLAFFLYRGICRFLCHFRTLWGACPRMTPLDPALKVMAPRPRLIGKCVYLLRLNIYMVNLWFIPYYVLLKITGMQRRLSLTSFIIGHHSFQPFSRGNPDHTALFYPRVDEATLLPI